MRFIRLLTAGFCILTTISVWAQQKGTVVKPASTIITARTIPFDEDWSFTKDNITEAEYNKAKWRTVDLPHDWSIEDLPNRIADSISGPFSKGSASKLATGFTLGHHSKYRL